MLNRNIHALPPQRRNLFFHFTCSFGSEYIVFGRILARFIKFIAVLTQTSQRFLIDLIGLFPSHRIQRIRRVQRAGGIKRITGLKSASQRFRYPVRFSAGSNSPRNCRFRQRRIAIGNDRLDQLTVSRFNRILFKIIRISSGSLYKREPSNRNNESIPHRNKPATNKPRLSNGRGSSLR